MEIDQITNQFVLLLFVKECQLKKVDYVYFK